MTRLGQMNLCKLCRAGALGHGEAAGPALTGQRGCRAGQGRRAGHPCRSDAFRAGAHGMRGVPSCRRSKPSLISSSPMRSLAQQASDRQPPPAIELDKAREIANRHAGGDVAALDRTLLGHEAHRRERQHRGGRRQARGDRGAAAACDLVGEVPGPDRRCRARALRRSPPPRGRAPSASALAGRR